MCAAPAVQIALMRMSPWQLVLALSSRFRSGTSILTACDICDSLISWPRRVGFHYLCRCPDANQLVRAIPMQSPPSRVRSDVPKLAGHVWRQSSQSTCHSHARARATLLVVQPWGRCLHVCVQLCAGAVIGCGVLGCGLWSVVGGLAVVGASARTRRRESRHRRV